MANSNLVEVTMEIITFRAISEKHGKSKRLDKARIFNFVKNILDESDLSDGSCWEGMKSVEDQGVIINRQFLLNV